MQAKLYLTAAFAAAAASAAAAPADYEIDPEHVTVAFLVEHVGYAKVLGQFLVVEGSYRFDEATGELADVEVVVATESLTTHHEERDRHLRSGDFLAAREFPEIRFTGATARRTGERTYEIEGRLELLGETRPVTLAATWNKSAEYPFGGSGYVMGVSARATLARSDFGMTYGVDNGWVGDEVEVIIELEASRRE